MSTTRVLDNEFASIVYHEEKKIVHHTFHKEISGEEFRNVLNRGVDVMKKNNANKWLSDDRKNSVLPDDDTAWAMSNWFPRAKEAGWQYWALVVPPDIKARLNLLGFVITYGKDGLKIQLFTDLAEAREWLESV